MIAVPQQPKQIVRKTLSTWHPTHKRNGRVDQVVEWLSSNHEVLNSNPVPKKKKKDSGSTICNITMGYLRRKTCIKKKKVKGTH
jgi:hypothetical protein